MKNVDVHCSSSSTTMHGIFFTFNHCKCVSGVMGKLFPLGKSSQGDIEHDVLGIPLTEYRKTTRGYYRALVYKLCFCLTISPTTEKHIHLM